VGFREYVVAAFGERAPGLHLHAPVAHELPVGLALEERVRLDLVDGRRDVVVLDEVDEPVGVEVGDADGLDQAVAVEVLHSPPGAVVVADGLVDEVQVEVVQAKALQGLLEFALGGVFTRVLDPHFGGDEELVAGDAALGDRAADGFLVVVGGGGVDGSVAGGQGVADDLLGLFVGYLEHAETEHWHLDTVVEGDEAVLRRHGGFLRWLSAMGFAG
jgi:hypothetical protein